MKEIKMLERAIMEGTNIEIKVKLRLFKSLVKCLSETESADEFNSLFVHQAATIFVELELDNDNSEMKRYMLEAFDDFYRMQEYCQEAEEQKIDTNSFEALANFMQDKK